MRRRSLGSILVLLLIGRTAPAATYQVSGFSDTPVVSGLTQPTDFAFTPDGSMLVIEKPGRIRIVVNGTLQSTPALDLTAKVDNGSETGLLGICLHPTFPATGWIYVYYTTNTPSVKNRISRFTLSGTTIDPTSESVILDDITVGASRGHNGGTVAIGPDGKLYAAPGDAGTSGNSQILDPGNFNGKVLRMELDGSPASGNPFLGDSSKEPRIFAYGFRNPFRFSFRPGSGALYLGDVGSVTDQDREEVNVVVSGGNYGWPWAEGSNIITPPCTGCRPPAFEYARTTGTTVIGGVFVTGNAYPTLQGRYVFGDNTASWIRYLEFDSNEAVVGTFPSNLHDLAVVAEGPVAFHQGPDGYLYYSAIVSGKIYRINFGRRFYTVTPCRVLDTRDLDGPYGGPALVAGADRTFTIEGQCEIPTGARAIAANLTVTGATDGGHLVVLPAGGALPDTSVINFRAGQTRANNAIVTLGPDGGILVRTGMPSGATHFILDVTGYFD